MSALLDAPTKVIPGRPMPVLDLDTTDGAAAFRRFFAQGVLGIPPLEGGAETFTDEGLDHMLARVPMATTAILTTYYLGLFTTQTAATVPPRTTLLSAAGVGEPVGAGYARVAMANTDWGAPATNGSGRRTTGAQKSTAESTGAWGTINGFHQSNQLAAGAGSIALYYANFDDTTAVPATVAGYTVRITPYFQIDV